MVDLCFQTGCDWVVESLSWASLLDVIERHIGVMAEQELASRQSVNG